MKAAYVIIMWQALAPFWYSYNKSNDIGREAHAVFIMVSEELLLSVIVVRAAFCFVSTKGE